MKARRYLCPGCGETFESTWEKKYCSRACYMKTDAFIGLRESRRAAQLAQQVKSPCLNCGAGLSSRPGRIRRFCSVICRRAYFAGRFDRNVANPPLPPLKQNFDEFLARERIACPVDGCGWEGVSLAHHANFAHGIGAHDLKEALGFNKSTGLITPEVWEARSRLSKRTMEGKPIPCGVDLEAIMRRRGPASAEAKEHMGKARDLRAMVVVMEPKPCRHCGESFTPSPKAPRQWYCTPRCAWRQAHQRRKSAPLAVAP